MIAGTSAITGASRWRLRLAPSGTTSSLVMSLITSAAGCSKPSSVMPNRSARFAPIQQGDLCVRPHDRQWDPGKPYSRPDVQQFGRSLTTPPSGEDQAVSDVPGPQALRLPGAQTAGRDRLGLQPRRVGLQQFTGAVIQLEAAPFGGAGGGGHRLHGAILPRIGPDLVVSRETGSGGGACRFT